MDASNFNKEHTCNKIVNNVNATKPTNLSSKQGVIGNLESLVLVPWVERIPMEGFLKISSKIGG